MNIKKEFIYILRRVIVAIIIILIMAFIDSKIPKALSLYSGTIGINQITGYDRIYNGYFINDGNLLSNNFTINYELSNINISNYDYFITHLYFNYADISDYSGTSTETQPVENTQYYCSSWSQRQQTYADGTQSTYYICEIWSPSGQSSTYANAQQGDIVYNNKIQLQVDLLMDNNYWSVCTIQNDSNGVSTITCPLNNNRTSITRLRIRYINLQWVEGNRTTSIGISNVYNLYRDPVRDLITQDNNNTQSIINNQNQNAQQNHQDMQEMNNTLKDSSVDSNNASTTINNASSLLPTDNNVSSLIGLPITFVESVLNGISGSCTPIHLFDLNMSQLENSSADDWSFTLDCIDLSEILGNTWVIIDTIMSALIVYAIAKFFVRIFIKITQMDYNIVEEAYKND